MKTSRIVLFGMFGALVSGCAPSAATRVAVAPEPAGDPLMHAAATILPRDFYARIGFLASDALQGRDTPSPGLEAAAAYIGAEFYRMGLVPGGTDGYLQRWPYVTRALDVTGTRFELETGAGRRALTYRSDFYAAPGMRAPFSGGLLFAGREIPPPEVRQETLRDRAVMVYAPQVSQVALTRLRMAADSAGAAAIIVALGADATEAAIAQAAAAAERPARAVPQLPIFFVRHDRARELFRDAALDFDALTRADGPQRPVALAGVTAHVGAPAPPTEHRPANVVGVLPGSDPVLRHTYVVFSAHYDHVGAAGVGSGQCRPRGDNRICNGADDDASGTAAVMEIAEAFAQLPAPPRRSIIFLLVSGEEKGLLGSRYFADHPTVPIDSIVANINMDMVGRNHPDSVVVIGQTYSSLGPLLHQVNERLPELRMTISDDPWPEQRFFFRSDHYNFARREVPAIFFFTGVHEDYHQPTDTVDRIDLDKITRIARLAFHYAHTIADDTQRPSWVPEGLEEVRRMIGQGR
jgi:Zn-dependent M28 family amino/carboxypeptidase